MRIRRVRLDELAAGTVRVRGDEAHHLARVLRVRPGDPVEAFDGRGREADGAVVAVDDAGVELRLEAPRSSSREAPLELVLAVALLKGDKLSRVVRQATELGAARIVPFVARRGEVLRLSPGKAERLRRVAAEAAKQCGRARVPAIDEALPLADLAWEGAAWVADPGAERGVAEATDALVRDGVPRLTAISGPEGGFAPDELGALRERGAVPVSFGPRVLRAETAPLALAAAVLARVES